MGSLLAAFFARRVKRLLPALLVMVVGASVASAMLVSPVGRQLDDIYLSGMLALVGCANNRFASLTSGGDLL